MMAVENKLDVGTIRKDFPALNQEVHGNPLVYLDNAATTLKPQCVIDALQHYYRDLSSNVHRGLHYLSEESTRLYEASRKKVQQFIHAHQCAEIIFTRGTTESINLVAQSYGRKYLKAGDEILISYLEHHSNIVPWQMLCQERGCVLKVVPINDQGDIVYEEYLKLLNPRTKFVAMTYISNALGTINPIKKVIEAGHAQNIPVLVDAAQAVGKRVVDVQDLDCDFLAFSGHKMFGPTGIGVLYGRAELLNCMPPVQGGGDMILSVSFDKTTYNTIPYKFEAGTPHVAGVIGLGAAIDYLMGFDMEELIRHEQDVLCYGTQILQGISGLRLIGTSEHKTSILSFVFENIHAHDIGTIVDECGVAIRAGHHCAQPLMKRFSVPATARASMSVYNTVEEMDRLCEAVYKVKEIFR